MKINSRFFYGLALCGALMLSACGSVPSAPAAQTDPPYGSTVSVPVQAGASRAQVEAQYGGHVVVWHPEAGFAILGLKDTATAMRSETLGLLPMLPELNALIVRADGAGSAWQASGRAYFWSGGRAYFWSGGRAYFWSGGSSTVGVIPENEETWTRLGLPQAWTLAPHLGDGVKVAVIDTGIDLTHDLFQDSLGDPADRRDFVDGDAVPQEEGSFDDAGYGHGTEVAGIVLQAAPHAQLMPLRVLRPDGSGDVTTVALAIDWAVAHGARVINLSLGSAAKSNVIKTMVQFAEGRGVYVVASAGNSGTEGITYPARYAQNDKLAEQLLSVGSVDATDRKSSFGAYGKELELSAPGEMVYGPVPGNLISWWSGTSMAAPMVSGSLALALGEKLQVSTGTLGSQLISTGVDISSVNRSLSDKVGRRLNIGAFIKSVVQP